MYWMELVKKVYLTKNDTYLIELIELYRFSLYSVFWAFLFLFVSRQRER